MEGMGDSLEIRPHAKQSFLLTILNDNSPRCQHVKLHITDRQKKSTKWVDGE